MSGGTPWTPGDWALDPVCWPLLDEDEREHQIAALQCWLTWLTERYVLDFRSVPTCWREHGSVLEELSALHVAWVRANVVG